MIIKLLVEGGSMKPGPAIAQKLGPLGINIGKVIQQVNDSTKNFSGLKVPVELDINTKTKNFTVTVFSPPVAELIKKELEIEKASGETKKLKAGNLSIEQIIKIAKTKQHNMLAKDLKSAVKSVIGSCVSLGVLIESKEAKEVEKEVFSGKYDKEISQGKEQTSEEKSKQLKEYFKQLRTKQEEVIRKEQEAKAAEEAAKAPAAAPQAVGEKAPEKAVEEKKEKK